jgi:lipopolysaccharide transport system ATP-binding protein
MHSDVAISVKNLSKTYRIFGHPGDRIKQALTFGKKRYHKEFTAIKDVSFEIKKGETVGIIGRNGSGKSTLLQLICGILKPTSGSVEVNGRISALLELGAGFNPEFTGRENVYFQGAVMGFTKAEMDARFDEIAAFADIGEFIDQPVRMYSSGMHMRLAFSVATAHRPDILIVDEAFSVGDVFFQHKSFERIRQHRKDGTTLLIVSHEKAAIQAICDCAILLNGGQIAMQGEPEAVMDYYNALLPESENQAVRQQNTEDGKTQTISGTGEATIEEVALLNENGERVQTVGVGVAVTLQVRTRIHQAIPSLVLGYMIKDRLGQTVYGTNTYHLGRVLENLQPESSVEFYFKFSANLGPGTYSIAVALQEADTHLGGNFEWRDLALIFGVVNTGKYDFVGVAWLQPQLECVQ